MRTSLSTGAMPTDVFSSEREVPEVSTADAAAFLATVANLASAIHSASSLPDLSEAALIDGTDTHPTPVSARFQSALDGISAESLLGAPSQNAVSNLDSEAMMPLLFEGSANDGEYVAPALLLPSAGTDMSQGAAAATVRGLDGSGDGTSAKPHRSPAAADDSAPVQSTPAKGSVTASSAATSSTIENAAPENTALENTAPRNTAAGDTAMENGATADGARRNSARENPVSPAKTPSAAQPASAPNAHAALTSPLPHTLTEPSSHGGDPSSRVDTSLHGSAEAVAQGQQTQSDPREPHSGGRQNSERHHGGAPQPSLPQQASELPQADALELSALNPEQGTEAFESTALEGAESSVATTSNLDAASTTSQSATEPRTSSPSRLLEHLRASFPAAEVRIAEGRAGETLVSMNHPDFGAVELKLQMTAGGIDIGARVDGAIAASLLRQSETSLRKTIHRQGLSLGRLRVERNEKNPSRRPVRGIDLEA